MLVLTTAIYILLPIACILYARALLDRSRLALAFVIGTACYEFTLLITAMASGAIGLLSPWVLLASETFVAAGLVPLVCWGLGRPRPDPAFSWIAWLRTRRGRLIGAAVLLTAGHLALLSAMDWILGTQHTDALTCHLPRAYFWSVHGNFGAWSTSNVTHVGLPIAGDLIVAQSELLRRGHRGAGYVSLILTIASCTSVYTVARNLRASRWLALVASLLFFSLPCVGGRAASTNTDFAAAFAGLAACAMVLEFPRARSVAMGILLLGVTVACKPTAFPAAFVALVACVAFRRAWARSWQEWVGMAAGAVLGGALVLGSYAPVFAEFGNPFGVNGAYYSPLLSNHLNVLGNLASHSLQWVLEPLGYVPRPVRNILLDGLRLPSVYRWLGSDSPPAYPNAYAETTRTGALPVILLPLLLACRRDRRTLVYAGLAAAAFVGTAVLSRAYTYSPRYFLGVCAILSLLWARVLIPRRARRCAGFVVLVLGGLSLAMSLNVTAKTLIKWQRMGAREGFPAGGGYPSEAQLAALPRRPFGVIADDEPTVELIRGVDGRFDYRPVTCQGRPWRDVLTAAGKEFGAIILIHGEARTMTGGPKFTSRHNQPCPARDVAAFRDDLAKTGWTMTKQTDVYDLWTNSANVIR